MLPFFFLHAFVIAIIKHITKEADTSTSHPGQTYLINRVYRLTRLMLFCLLQRGLLKRFKHCALPIA